jgi:hypothetical protein
MNTEEKIQLALAELGDNYREIAGRLSALGCRGDLHKSESCPLARYLTSKVDKTVYVGLTIANWWENDEMKTIRLSQPVLEFRRNFDNYEFPELIK